MNIVEIKFPVGPNETAHGVLRKAEDPKTRTPVFYRRGNEVLLPNGEWYTLKDEDYFGAWV